MAALYALNRWVLIPCSSGLVHRLLAWHGADLLAGALMLCVVNAALDWHNVDTLRGLLHTLTIKKEATEEKHDAE